MKPSQLKRPFICADLSETSSAAFIRQIESIEDSSKADCYEINLAPLRRGRARDIFSVTEKPCIVTNRRPRVMRSYGFEGLPEVDEKSRVDRMVECIGAGAAALDIEIDTFDYHGDRGKPSFGTKQEIIYASKPRAKPTEMTNDPRATEKQRAVIREVNSLGGEVLISCHSQVRMRKRLALELATTMERRGADLAKVVVMTLDGGDILAMLESTLELGRTVRIPFCLMNQGKGAKLGRVLSAAYGASWVFCRPPRGAGYQGQPTIGEARDFLRLFSKSDHQGQRMS